MQNASAEELAKLLEIVAAVGGARDLDTFRRAAMDSLAEVMPAAKVSYNEIAFDGRPLVTLSKPDQPEELFAIWERVAPQNPLLRHYLATRDGRALRTSDVVDRATFEATDFYRELLVPMGVAHQMAVTIPAPPELLIGVVVSDPDDFSDSQRRLLDLARPHLIQAHANASLREELTSVVQALAVGLDDTADAIVVAGPDQRVRFATEAGRAVLAQLGAVGQGVALPPALVGGDTERVLLDTGDRTPLVVRRLRVDARGTTVLVLERGTRGASRDLLEAMGLSPREAQVLQAMMRGRSTAEIAGELVISRSTVYKHAERIFAKLGVNDRVGAISAAWAAIEAGSRSYT